MNYNTSEIPSIISLLYIKFASTKIMMIKKSKWGVDILDRDFYILVNYYIYSNRDILCQMLNSLSRFCFGHRVIMHWLPAEVCLFVLTSLVQLLWVVEAWMSAPVHGQVLVIQYYPAISPNHLICFRCLWNSPHFQSTNEFRLLYLKIIS